MAGLQGATSAEGPTGRYRTVLLLGQGGTADVHLAVAEGPGDFRKLVVLKALRAALAHDPELRAMFLNEARLAARLHHPNVVQTYEVLEQPSGPSIVMEYLDGEPFSNLIVRGRGAGLTLAMQLRILGDALLGLHAAHELRDFDGTPLGVVHRDVSPQNLFVTVEGQTKVLDFGIAKLDRSLVETEVGTVKGKLRYMAPEQLRGDALDRRADLYAAGVILWEALAGERMWKGLGDPEIRARVGAGDVPPPPRSEQDPSGALQRICRSALAGDPRERPPTALAMAEQIEAALERASGGAPGARQLGALVARLCEDARAARQAAIEARVGRPGSARTTVEVPAPGFDAALDSASGPIGAATATPRSARSPRRWIAVALLAAAAFLGWAYAAGRADRAAPRMVAAAPGSPPILVPPAPPAPERPPVPEPDRAARPRPEKPAGKRVARPTAVPVAAPAPVRDCTHPFFVDSDGIKKYRPECM
jgi:serine/threonine-protein kinase